MARKLIGDKCKSVVLIAAGILACFGLTVGYGDIAALPSATTFAEVQPKVPISTANFVINQPGSYYLTGNLYADNVDAIIVRADDVTLDLMGFTLAGVQPYRGIFIEGGRKNVEIRNGTIRGFGSGISTDFNEANEGHSVIGVRIVENDGSGIYLVGSYHLIKNCTVACNAGSGIYAYTKSRVIDNSVYLNQGDGIWTLTGATVRGNTVNDCDGAGIFVSSFCTVMDNTVVGNNTPGDNSLGGIRVNNGCLVKNNTVGNNGYCNVNVRNSGNALEENLLTDSENGVWFDCDGNYYDNNRAARNTNDYESPRRVRNRRGRGNASF